MMQVQDEIEDPEGYCMLKIEKIEPIHGSLRQGVQMGHIKPDRAEELKSKFEDLREALRMKFATQRKLAAEKSELEFEKQQQEGKLEKSRKEAKRDAETIAIIGEDAEEADAEAAMALERCDKALVEMEEDRTMKISYQQRIVEIKREHVLALEPVISRLKQEIKTEGEEIKERIGKLAQSVKEIEDSKSNHVRLMEETKSLNMDKFDVNTKLEELAGKPETLKKQVDILRNALKASYAQLEKWTAKIGDAEKQLHGVKATIKSKREEHVHAVASYHKMRLNEQEQERIANDSVQTLQRASGDAEVYYNDQVYLDLQLMGRLLELKHVQELHVKALREREKTLSRLQQVQEQVQELQANLPVYNQEKKKAHKEFLTVEEETMKWEEVVANSRRDVVQTLQSLRKSELLGDEVLKQVRDCNRKVQELEKEMAKLIKEDRRVEKVKSDLKKQTERLSRLAALKFSMWKETLKRVEVEQGYIKGFMKRVEQLTKENQDNVLLYNNIRSQRNRLLRSVEESAITILEMRDKLSPMTQQMENLRNDVTYKITVYDKLHEHVLDSLQASAYVKQDISKCYITLAQTKVSSSDLICTRPPGPRIPILQPNGDTVGCSSVSVSHSRDQVGKASFGGVHREKSPNEQKDDQGVHRSYNKTQCVWPSSHRPQRRAQHYVREM